LNENPRAANSGKIEAAKWKHGTRLVPRNFVILLTMHSNRSFWHSTVVVAVLAAFVGLCGHEFVHVEHSQHCTVCRVGHVGTADLPAAVTLAVIFAVIFFLAPASPTRPIAVSVYRTSGRSPPSPLV
jgi:hypothetical protein